MTTGVPNRLSESAAKLAAEGKFAEAITELKKALEINPRSEQLQYVLAQRYAQAGDPVNAIRWLETAIKRQPNQWKARAADDPLFTTLRERGDFQRLVSH
jgi:tetratricopeptide (TPR) repeat protein